MNATAEAEAASATAAAESLAPPPPLTAEAIDDLKTRAARADEHWDRLLRATADFENFKKRAARERQEAAKFASEGLLLKLLPVLDNFEMALASSKNSSAESVKSLQAGVEMICQQLKNALKESGLEELDASGQLFDPNLHEAISQRESAEVPEGHVLQQVRKGYRLQGRLLRPATVIVAKAPVGAAPEAE